MESEFDILMTAIVILGGWLAVMAFPVDFDRRESTVIGLAFLAHIGSVAVQIWMATQVYRNADMLVYVRFGTDLANGMREDLAGVLPEVVKLIFQQPHKLSIYVPAPGTSVATMCGLTSLGVLLLGTSLAPVSLVFAMAAFLGKMALYAGLRQILPARFRNWLLLGTLFVPSTVFWTAGVIKEAVALAGLGPTFLGVAQLSSGRRLGWLPLIGGSIIIMLVKPYILLAFAGASGVAYYWIRSIRNGRVEIRPGTLLISVGAAVGGVLLVAELFPRYALDSLVDEAARLQAAGMSDSGGSNYIIGDPRSRTLAGQLLFAPMALLTALYRPLIIEARNPMMLVNALETTAVLTATFWVFVRNRVTDIAKSFVTYPGLAFCLAFVILLGIPVGLTSANLGTLSRYRVPIVPFQVVLILVLANAAPVRRREPARALALPDPLSRRTA